MIPVVRDFTLRGSRQTGGGKEAGMGADTSPEQGGLWEQGQGQIQCLRWPSFFGTTSTGSLAKGEGLQLRRRRTRAGWGNWKSAPSSASNWLSPSGPVAFWVYSLICEMGGGPPMKSVVRVTGYEVLCTSSASSFVSERIGLCL